VFYEGKTREQPLIALLPADGGAQSPSWNKRTEEKEVALINTGKFPIYDVIAVYRDSKRGILWTGSIPMFPAALPPLRGQAAQALALRIPDFFRPRLYDDLKVEKEEFSRRTRDRLLENLTAGFH
jgi:hypothetical protein|tara:strand:+ start:6454 stop:6828 length:375 start_codon:yes stop_codon:yes gene_type:complete